jgi:hypothetical protein
MFNSLPVLIINELIISLVIGMQIKKFVNDAQQLDFYQVQFLNRGFAYFQAKNVYMLVSISIQRRIFIFFGEYL